MTTTTTTQTIESPSCPECTQAIDLEDPLLGELIDCPGCQAELEVRGIDPLQLAPAPEIMEDWGE